MYSGGKAVIADDLGVVFTSSCQHKLARDMGVPNEEMPLGQGGMHDARNLTIMQWGCMWGAGGGRGGLTRAIIAASTYTRANLRCIV